MDENTVCCFSLSTTTVRYVGVFAYYPIRAKLHKSKLILKYPQTSREEYFQSIGNIFIHHIFLHVFIGLQWDNANKKCLLSFLILELSTNTVLLEQKRITLHKIILRALLCSVFVCYNCDMHVLSSLSLYTDGCCLIFIQARIRAEHFNIVKCTVIRAHKQSWARAHGAMAVEKWASTSLSSIVH